MRAFGTKPRAPISWSLSTSGRGSWRLIARTAALDMPRDWAWKPFLGLAQVRDYKVRFMSRTFD